VLCFGSPGKQQLGILPQHVPSTLSSLDYHPFQYIDFKEQAYIRKQAAQHTADRIPDRGAKFFMDFGLIRALADDYKCPDKKTDCIVLFYNSHSAYLVIIDSASRRVWTFLTSSKDPHCTS
jgi:hypothetical protein